MGDALHPLELIAKKRDGQELSTAEVQQLVQAVVRRAGMAGAEQPQITEAEISDPQIAAFLMAVFLRGLSARELADLTQAMRYSGETLHLQDLGAYTVDKHSTGGVGDKTSLLLAPILAAASAAAPARKLPRIAVPMISGRSLGHTGGTLDKLESIPGFRTQLSLSEIVAVLRQTHAVMVGQTPTLVPADRILYALRDHTATVESPFLITASIMSKKLAEDLRGLVLDVKVGSGAFMPSVAASRQLAELLVETGTRAGTHTVALLTSMDQPLGRFAGNWLEVRECVDLLQGRRHPLSSDLLELTLALAGHMLHLAGHAASPEAGAALADGYLLSGAAYAAWTAIVAAQGGEISVFNHPAAYHAPRASRIVSAPQNSFFASMDCKQVGWAVQRLGAGRAAPGGPVSAHAGIEVHAKLGDRLQAGQTLFTLFSEDPDLLDEPSAMLAEALQFSPDPVSAPALVRGVVQAGSRSGQPG